MRSAGALGSIVTPVSAADIVIRWANSAEEVRDALALRELVFCGEQGVPLSEERDRLDEEASHLVALSPESQRVIGTLRLLVSGEAAKVGRVAVDRAWRRRGVALRMLELALERAREQGCVRARLAAQLEAIELYRQAGFAVESEPFEEAGIMHVWMGRTLGAEAATLAGD